MAPVRYLTNAYFQDALTRRERMASLQHERMTEEERQIEAMAWLVVLGVAWSAVAIVWAVL